MSDLFSAGGAFLAAVIVLFVALWLLVTTLRARWSVELIARHLRPGGPVWLPYLLSFLAWMGVAGLMFQIGMIFDTHAPGDITLSAAPIQLLIGHVIVFAFRNTLVRPARRLA